MFDAWWWSPETPPVGKASPKRSGWPDGTSGPILLRSYGRGGIAGVLAFLAFSLVSVMPGAAAEPSFACVAQGSTWSVSGAAQSHMTCQFTCALKAGAEVTNNVSCTATVAGDGKASTPCQGFMLGRRWTSAELVAEQCSIAP